MNTELDLHGRTVVDALVDLDLFLNQAFVRGLRRVKIIHGRGTGALRNAVRDALAEHSLVNSFRFGDPGEGDYGITIVELAE